MKHRINQAAAGILLAVSFPATAEMVSSFNPYVGAEAQYRHMPFEMNYGGNIFKKKYPQANFFVGNRFNEYFGLEFGYNVSKKLKRDARVGYGELLAGANPFVAANEFFDAHATSKISAVSLNAVSYLPISSLHGLELIGSAGFTKVKVSAQYSLFNDNTGPINPPIVRTFSEHQIVMRLAGGAQYPIIDNLRIRALINWENTKRFQNIRAKEKNDPILKIRNSITYSLGLSFSF